MLTLVLAALGAAAPGVAHAGSYSVVACNRAPGGLNNAWAPSVDPQGPTLGASCPATTAAGGLFATAGSGSPEGTHADWRFVAPTGTRIASLTLDRYLSTTGGGWDAYVRTDDGVALETCPGLLCPAGAAPGGVGESRTFSFSSGGAGMVAVGLQCVSGICTGPAVAALHGASVTLTAAEPPALTSVGGSLWATGGFHHGVEEASFQATDAAGIATARVWADGVAQAAVPVACDYTYAVPCPDLVPGSVSYDTRALSDGDHTIQIGVRDPAANETRSVTQAIVVDNTAPAAPNGLTVAGGEGYRTTNRYDVSWSAPGGQIAPIAKARYRICRAGTTECQPEQLSDSAAEFLSGITLPGAGEWTLSVWLEDGAGNTASANAATATLRLGAIAPVTQDAPGLVKRKPARGNLAIAIVKVARSGAKLTFTGRVGKGATAAMSGKYTFKHRGRTRTVSAKAKPRTADSTVRLTFKLPSGIHSIPRGTIALTYPGDDRYLPRKLSLRVPRPRG